MSYNLSRYNFRGYLYEKTCTATSFILGWLCYFVSRLYYDWVISYLVIWKYTSCWQNTRKIQNCKHYACATHLSLLADLFYTEMRGRFAFTWYRCDINFCTDMKFLPWYNNPGELMLGWLVLALYFVVVLCKQMWSHERELEWTHFGVIKQPRSIHRGSFPQSTYLSHFVNFIYYLVNVLSN